MSVLTGDWEKIKNLFNPSSLKNKIRQCAEKVGNYGASEVKKGIVNGNFTPLHPFTIIRKSSSKPLIDHGDLIGSVTYQVLDDNDKIFIGVNKGKEVNIAIVQEFGCTIRVTPKMRAYLHYQGLHLKESTEFIHIPARPFLRPVLLSEDFKNKVGEIYLNALRGAFLT